MNIHVFVAEPPWRAIGPRNLIEELITPSTTSDLHDILRQESIALEWEFLYIAPNTSISDEDVDTAILPHEGNQLHMVWS